MNYDREKTLEFLSTKYGRRIREQELFEIEQNLMGYVKWHKMGTNRKF